MSGRRIAQGSRSSDVPISAVRLCQQRTAPEPGAARLSFRRYSAEISRPQCEAPPVLTQTTSRVLEPSDLDAALAVLDRDPVANAFVTSRVQVAGLDPWRLGGEMWGWYEDGMLTSLCYAGCQPGADLRDPRAVRAFADRARRSGRRCSSIVGPVEPTAQLWRLLEPSWGPAREIRAQQPLMVTDRMPADIAPDPYVRRIRKDEMETIIAGVRGDVHGRGRRLPAGRMTAASSTRPASPNWSVPAAPSPASTNTARSSSRRRSAPRRTGPARSRACGWPLSTGAGWRPRGWRRYCGTPWRTWPRW